MAAAVNDFVDRVFRQASRLWWLAIPAVAAVGWYYYHYNPAHSLFPRCPFHAATGLYCPGCGSQRAIHQLLHGHWLEAANYNLLATLMLPLIGLHLGAWAINRLFGTRLPLLFQRYLLAKWILVLVLLFWLLRNLPVEALRWLAP